MSFNKNERVKLLSAGNQEVEIYYSETSSCSMPGCLLIDKEGDFPKVGDVGFVVSFDNSRHGGSIDVCGRCLRDIERLIYKLNSRVSEGKAKE